MVWSTLGGRLKIRRGNQTDSDIVETGLVPCTKLALCYVPCFDTASRKCLRLTSNLTALPGVRGRRPWRPRYQPGWP